MYQAKVDFVKEKSSERDQGRRWLVSMHHLSCKHGPIGRLAENRMYRWATSYCKQGYRHALVSRPVLGWACVLGASEIMQVRVYASTMKMSASVYPCAPVICTGSPNPCIP